MTNTTKSFRVSDEAINLITTDIEDINVIPIQEYIIDIKKRAAISNHEIQVLIKDLKWVYNKSKPTIDQGFETLVNVYNKIGKAVAKSYDTKAKTDDVNWFSIHPLCDHVPLLDDVHSTWETTMNHDDEYHGDINYGNLYPDDWFWMEDDSDEEESDA